MRWKRPTFKGRRAAIVAVTVGLVIVAGGVGAWAVKRASASDPAAPTLVSATTTTIRQSVSATGTIEPANQANLSFAVSGTVTAVPVAVGDQVKAGTALATVDSSSLKSAVTLARASLTANQDQLTAQQGAGSSTVQVASTEAQIAAAASKLTDAQTALAEATMTSPVAGTVAQVNIAVGDKTSGASGSGGSSGSSGSGGSSGSSSGSSTAQIIVISTTSWVVDASVSSADLPQLKKGLQAEITPSGSTTKVFGTVKSVGIVATSSSSGSASFPVTIAVTGSPKGLYVGGAVDVAIIVKQLEDVLTVPTNALHTANGKPVVYQMKNGTQVSTPVTVGATYGPVTQILNGLKTGDKVVDSTFRIGSNGSTGGNRTRQGGTGGSGTGGFGGGAFNGPPPGAVGGS